VARTDQFQELVHDLAMHVAAANPLVVKREDLSPELLAKETEIYRNQALATGKPEKVVDKIVEGKLKKYYSEVCLYEQPYIKDSDMTVEDLVNSAIASIKENIVIGKFARFKVGE
jgi:elongation factor Ts